MLGSAAAWSYSKDKYQAISDEEIESESVAVFNLIGQKVNVPFNQIDPYRIEIILGSETPGIYVIRFAYANDFVTRKISFVPR